MPATITITRAAFNDADSIPATTFNGVTIVSAIVADATAGAEGVIRLAGDLTGGAAAPVLVTSGVTAGAYGGTGLKVTTFTVDAKGRLTAAAERDLPLPDAAVAVGATPAVKGLVALAGDLTGTAAAPVLVTSGVTAATYGAADQVLEIAADPAALAALVVGAGDVAKRIVRVTSTGLYYLATTAGSGLDKWTQQTPIANGLITFPVLTFDAKGRATVASIRTVIVPEAAAGTKGLIQIAGDLTGTAAAPTLVTSGVVAGQYGVIETAADPAALAALVVAAADVGRRVVRVTSTGTIYRASATGSGLDKWTAPATIPFADLLVTRTTFDAKGRATSAEPVPVAAPSGTANVLCNFNGFSTALYRTVRPYARAANIVTVTDAAHGLRVGDKVYCDVTSGGLIDGLYTVETVPDPDSFTFTVVGANTGGNITLRFYEIRYAMNVHSVTWVAGDVWWINFTAPLARATYIVQATAEQIPGSYNSYAEVHAPGGVANQTAAGVGIAATDTVRNLNVAIFGGA